MSPSRLVHIICILIVSSLFTSISSAQITGVSNDQATPVPGVGHNYIKSLSETVEPSNGQLSINIRVPTAPARGAAAPFVYAYNSAGVHHVLPYMHGQGLWVTDYTNTQGSGWADATITVTMITVSYLHTGPPEYTASCVYFTNYVFQDPTGARHALALQTGQSNDPNSPNNCSQVPTYAGDNVTLAGDGYYTGNTTAPPIDTVPQNPAAVNVVDPYGTVYNCGAPSLLYAGYNTYFQAPCSAFEDRNGNTDLNPQPAIAVTTTSESTPWSFSFNYEAGNNLAQANCSGVTQQGGQLNVYSSINLPKSLSYQFSYHPSYGLVTQITYPSGGWVKYTWGLNSLAEAVQAYDVNGLSCVFGYDMPAITNRYVSFDGVNTALEQDFSYSTNWLYANGGSGPWVANQSTGVWASKQTIVVTKDCARNNFNCTGAPSFTTTYNYVSSGGLVGNQTAVESSLVYGDFSGSTLLTETKGWAGDELLCDLKTLNNGLISGTYYTYGSASIVQVIDKKEYDYGLISSASACYTGVPQVTAPSGVTPTRDTVTNYQSFAATPIFPAAPSILDRPSSVITYSGSSSGGTRAAETDYSYDQTSVAGVSPTATGHDETSYGPGYNNRGNLTTVVKQCFNGACTGGNPTTKYTYDETGQRLSKLDPCGNTACSDMTGSSHTTNYSYSDSYTTLSGSQNNSYSPTCSPSPCNTNTFLTKITDPLGHTENFTYDYNNGQLTASTDPNSQTTSYVYSDAFNRPTTVTYPTGGGSTTITYNDSSYNPSTPSPSVTTTKANSSGTNVVTVSAMDGLGHVVQTRLTSDAAGTDYTATTYDGLGRPYQVYNPTRCSPPTSNCGEATWGFATYTYDGLGRTIQVSNPDNSTITTIYTGRATEVQDEGNGSQRVTRVSQTDGLGRLVSVCEVASGPFVGTGGSSSSSLIGSAGTPSGCNQDITGASDTGFLTTYLYDILNDLTQVNQPDVSARTFAYDSLSRLTTATNPESGSTAYSYDANSNLSTKTDARSIVSTFGYDVVNRILSKAYSDGTPGITNTYDAATISGLSLTYLVGRLVETSTNDGLTATVNSYDQMGRINNQWQCTPQNCGAGYFSLPYGYDLLGNVTSAGNGMNVTITYGPFNGADELPTVSSSLIDENHPATLFSGATYTPFAAISTEQLGNGVAEARAYNTRLWLTSLSATNPTGGSATPGTGTVSVSGSEQSHPGTTGAPGTGTVTIAGAEQSVYVYPSGCRAKSCATLVYDSGYVYVAVNGHNDSVKYGETSTSVSIASALASAINADSAASVTASASSSVITLTAKTTGSTTNYTLATSVSYNTTNFSRASFTATPSGSTLTGGTNATSTTYDSGTVSIIVNGFTASYSYGQNDTATSIASGLAAALSSSSVHASSSGGTVTLTANTTGSNTNYNLSASSGSSDGFSPASFSASPSGTTLTGGTNDTVYSLALTSYAPDGDVLAANDSANGNWTYTYDPFNRVVGANQNNGQSIYNYVYDIAGNRWQQNGQYSMVVTFTGNNSANNNRMDGYSYDAAGNLLNDKLHSYTYDAENRVTQVDAGATATYIYDANGRRVRKTVGGVSVDYLYDLSNHEITEVNSSGGWNRGEVYAGDNHIATYNNGTTYFIHRDWLGTERVRSSLSGVSCETVTSLAFGDGMTTTGSCSDISPLHFTGKQRDTESGLDYFGARYNSSGLGRFMSPDPKQISAHMFDPQSFNRYAHTRNNPLAFVDPDGRDLEKAWSDFKGFANSLYAKLSVGVGAEAKVKAGPAVVKAGVALKANAETSQDSILRVSKSLEGGISAGTEEHTVYGVTKGAEQTVLTVTNDRTLTGEEPPKITSSDDKIGPGTLSQEKVGVGAEVGIGIVVGAEIGFTREGVGDLKDSVHELKDSLKNPGPPPSPTPPPPPPCASNPDKKCG
jgi:RHS repeat-associated protein